MSRRKRKNGKNRKARKIDIIPIIVIIGVILVVAGIFYLSSLEKSNAWKAWYQVQFDSSWTPTELTCWNNFLSKTIPAVEREIGRPKDVIKVKILKGSYVNKNFPELTYGNVLENKEVQEIYCPLPQEAPDVCLHELIHQFYKGHQPENVLFLEGMVVYLEKKIGDKIKINPNNPKSAEYYYHLQSSFRTLDMKELAPYFASGFSHFDPICKAQYGLYAYLINDLEAKRPGFVRELSRRLWETKPDREGYIVENDKCIKIAEDIHPGFRGWLLSHPGAQPNSEAGLRLVLCEWPMPGDLAVFHWETAKTKDGIKERPFEMDGIRIYVIKNNIVVSESVQKIRHGNVVLPNAINEAKQKFGVPLTIKIETGGVPNMTDELEINE